MCVPINLHVQFQHKETSNVVELYVLLLLELFPYQIIDRPGFKGLDLVAGLDLSPVVKDSRRQQIQRIVGVHSSPRCLNFVHPHHVPPE